MSGVQITVLTLVALWLGVLTVTLMTLVRQVSLLSLRTGLIEVPEPTNRAHMEIGLPVPEALLDEFPQLADGRPHYVLWLSGTCATCGSFARDLRRSTERSPFPDPIVAMVSGPERLARGVAGELPPGIPVVMDPKAAEAADDLRLPAAPYAVQVESGVVTGWTHVNRASDLRVLRRARRTSDAGKFAERARAEQAAGAHNGSMVGPDTADLQGRSQ